MEIKTKRLRLRELTIEDLPAIHHLHSQPETDRYNTLGIPENIDVTKKLLTDWLYTAKETPRKKYVFVIEKDGNEFVGITGMNIGKPKYCNAEIWFKLSQAFWNLGYATETVKALLNFGFTELCLHRIEAGCATENIASQKVLSKAGFIQEGLKRKVLPIRGEWMDNFEYAILETDFGNW